MNQAKSHDHVFLCISKNECVVAIIYGQRLGEHWLVAGGGDLRLRPTYGVLTGF